jgi:serine/threonine protein kinase
MFNKGKKTSGDNTPVAPDNESWHIDPKEIEFTDRLGTGTSAQVYKGRYKGKEVAIKILKSGGTDGKEMDAKQLRDFENECEIMSKARSPYILYFYGSCVEPQVCIVVEYCMRGSLYEVMSEETFNLTWERSLRWAKELAMAINYLHKFDPPVFHRDLKSPNLLLDNDWTIKVCDFGASRLDTPTETVTLGKMRGTYAYCAPELYFGTRFTTKSDVYSISIILWELFSRVLTGKYARPYSEYPQVTLGFTVIIKAAKNNLRPTIPSSMPAPIKELIENCWDPEPTNRPDCETVLKRLEEITQMYQQDKELWNSLRTTPQNISKKQNYLSKTESMRIPLSPKDMIDLRGFTNVVVEEGGEAPL